MLTLLILRTLGAGPRNILAAFTIQGAFIGLAGTAAGAALGITLSVNLESLVHALEHVLGTHFLDPKVYLMGDLPAYPELGDVLRIAAWLSRCVRSRRCIRPGARRLYSPLRHCDVTEAAPSAPVVPRAHAVQRSFRSPRVRGKV